MGQEVLTTKTDSLTRDCPGTCRVDRESQFCKLFSDLYMLSTAHMWLPPPQGQDTIKATVIVSVGLFLSLWPGAGDLIHPVFYSSVTRCALSAPSVVEEAQTLGDHVTYSWSWL